MDSACIELIVIVDHRWHARVGQFDSALLRYAPRLARRVEQGRSACYSGSDTRRRSCARHITQLDAMFNTPSQESAAPGHLPDPRPATGGVAAKWKALLFMAGGVFLFPPPPVPTNWLSARGLLQGRAPPATAGALGKVFGRVESPHGGPGGGG